MNNLDLKFSASSKLDWERKILSEKKLEPFKGSHKEKTEDINIHPIYHADDNIPTYECDFPDKWTNFQYINVINVQEANKQALEAIRNNVKGLCFSGPKNIEKLLKNIPTQKIRINFANYTIENSSKISDFELALDTYWDKLQKKLV